MRVSLSQRMNAIRREMQKHNPQGYAVHHLPPALRMRYELWMKDCAEFAMKFRSPGDYYAALVGGDVEAPAMPRDVAKALNDKPPIRIPANASLDDAAELYRQVLHGE